jgi:Ca-activated chloride channel family protein
VNFLSLSAFWFLAAVPVVVVFYLLKRKRVVRLVPSTLLWQRFLAETQASAPFQKLRHNWLLWIQLLLLLLAVLALARPYFAGKSSGGRILVVILDASASMQSIDQAPSRFEKAKQDALKLVDSLHDTDKMVVLQAAGNTEVKQSPTSEKSALRRALEACAASDSSTHLSEALKLAETLIQNNGRAEIHLFSDGACANLTEFENKALPVFFHSIGSRGNNVGIVNLDVRPNPENMAQRAIFTTVANYSSNTVQTELEFRLGDKLLEVKPITLNPKQTSPQVFLASQKEDGVFTVRLTGKDDLAVDNQASIVSLIPKPMKVLLVTAGNRFLQKAISAAPQVQLSTAASLTGTSSDFDLVVLDNVAPAVWPSGNVLSFRAANSNWFGSLSKLDAPTIVDWKASHPLLRFVTFDNVAISESIAVKTPPWAISLVDSPQSSLLLAGEMERQRVVWVGFDLLQSTWPLRISFPIFIANALDWLNPLNAQASQLSVKAGEAFRLALNDNSTSAEVLTPDGRSIKGNADPIRREFLFGDTAKQGIYHFRSGTNDVAFCVNLTDAAESDTTPRTELQFGKYSKTASTTLRQANLEFWRWIALAALFVLLFEWWFYHRRTA